MRDKYETGTPEVNGKMVRIHEVFCKVCGLSEIVGFDGDREYAEKESIEIGWQKKPTKGNTYNEWFCPLHAIDS